MSRDYQDQGSLDEPQQKVDDVQAEKVEAPVEKSSTDTADKQ